jgi:hypothetical protein
MLDFTDFAFPQLYVLPEFVLNLSSPDYENKPDFTFHSSGLIIFYARQCTSFPVSSQKWLCLNVLIAQCILSIG